MVVWTSSVVRMSAIVIAKGEVDSGASILRVGSVGDFMVKSA